MIKHIINTFVAIAACLGVAAFVMVLVKKQNCQTKEPLTTTSCGKLDDKPKSKNIEKFDWESGNIGVNQVPAPAGNPNSLCKGLKNAEYNDCCKVYDKGDASKWFVLPYHSCSTYFDENKNYWWINQAPNSGDNWGRRGSG